MAFAVTAAAAFATPLPAQSADKREYHLFNPTPRSLMREMSTDRPDVTESPYTVDAGHYQVELSFAEYGRDNDGPDVEEWSVLPVVLKAGLTYNVDLQLVVTPYIDLDVAGDSVSGFGETQVRVKVNLWGNDGPDPAVFGGSALAVMPFVQFPTGDEDLGFSDQVEGGVIFPFATSLPNEFDLGLMAEFDFVHDDFADEYDLLFVHTAAVGRDLTDELGAYVEYIGVAGDGDYAAAVGLGATYALSPDVQLDAGVNVGLNDDAEDFRLFSGLSFRL